MNIDYDPVIAAKLIESAAPNVDELFRQRLEFAENSAIFYEAKSENLERYLQTVLYVALGLFVTLAAVVAGVMRR